MPTNIEQIQPFLAKINGVEFNSELQFNTTKYILQMIEYELKAEITTQFVKGIKQLILDSSLTSELTYSDIEDILRDCVKNAKSFDTLQFDILYMENCTEHINHQLARDAYQPNV